MERGRNKAHSHPGFRGLSLDWFRVFSGGFVVFVEALEPRVVWGRLFLGGVYKAFGLDRGFLNAVLREPELVGTRPGHKRPGLV